jgi:hypothetical protein
LPRRYGVRFPTWVATTTVPGIIFAAVLAITGAMPTMNAHDHRRYRREYIESVISLVYRNVPA